MVMRILLQRWKCSLAVIGSGPGVMVGQPGQ